MRESSNASKPHSYGASLSLSGRFGATRRPKSTGTMPKTKPITRKMRTGRQSSSIVRDYRSIKSKDAPRCHHISMSRVRIARHILVLKEVPSLGHNSTHCQARIQGLSYFNSCGYLITAYLYLQKNGADGGTRTPTAFVFFSSCWCVFLFFFV